MKGWSIIGLLFAAAILATVPVSPQVTSRGLELGIDQAQAQTYGRTRRVARRVDRRADRYDRRADRRAYRYARRAGYGAVGFGGGYGAAGYGGYGAGLGSGYRRVWVGPRRWCNIYPSGFRWCWTYI
jgi:hypothetical protein